VIGIAGARDLHLKRRGKKNLRALRSVGTFSRREGRSPGDFRVR